VGAKKNTMNKIAITILIIGLFYSGIVGGSFSSSSS
jgi:hypothetical protein